MKFILFLIIAAANPSFAENDKKVCDFVLGSTEAAQQRLLYWLNTEPKKVNLDVDPSTLAAGQHMLRRLFIGSVPEYLQSIFSILSKEDIYKINELGQKGELQLTELQKNQLENLTHFVQNDPFDVLWDEDGAISALTTKYPDYRGPGHRSTLGGFIGGLDTSTITSLGKEILDAALKGLSDRFRRGGWLKRFWSPQYPHVVRILNFFDWIRESLEHVREVGETIQTVLQRAAEFRLTKPQIDQLNEKYDKITAQQRKNLRLVSEDVLGQDVFTGGYQSTGGIGIHELSKKIAVEQTKKVRNTVVEESEKVMDLIHSSLNENRRQNRQEPRTLSDYFETELKVRHRQYDRQSQEQDQKYLKLLERPTTEKVTVHYSWLGSETYWEEGKLKSRPATKYGSKTVYVLYQDILVYNLDTFKVNAKFDRGHSGATIDSVEGLDDVRRRVKNIIKSEAAYYSRLIKLVNTLRLDIATKHVNAIAHAQVHPNSLQSYLVEIQIKKQTLEKLLKAVTTYSQLSAGQVQSQWDGDNFEHFKLRTTHLAASITELVSLYEIYIEQVRRHQYELIITPDRPDYSTELAKLKFAMKANHATKYTMGGAAFIAVICGPSAAAYGFSAAAMIECINNLAAVAEIISALAQATGHN